MLSIMAPDICCSHWAGIVLGAFTRRLFLFPKRQQLFLCLCVILCLMVLPSSGSACHHDCTCNTTTKVVLCSKVSNVSWTEILSNLPDNTTYLVIQNTLWLRLPKEDTVYETTLPFLEKLEIRDSNFSNFHVSLLTSMPRLKELKVHNSSLSYINSTLNVQLKYERTILLPHLQTVDLSFNKLTQIPKELFPHIPNIERLLLESNELVEVNTNTLQNLTKLRVLDLSNNQIYFIHQHAFRNLSNLINLHLEHNSIEHLHAWTFEDLGQLSVVHLQNNPWDCNCGLKWLVKELGIRHAPNSVAPTKTGHRYNFGGDPQHMKCSNPPHLQFKSLHTLELNALSCREPVLHSGSQNLTILYMHMAVLQCNVTGYPHPSIYWRTPHGILVHPRQRRWLQPSILNSSATSLSFIGKPTFLNATIYTEEDGTLVFLQFRNHFSGEYECFAVNPAGMVSAAANVTISSNFHDHYVWSIVISYTAALAFLLLGIIIGALRLCCEKFCCRPPPKDLYVSVNDVNEEFSRYDDYYKDIDTPSPSIYQGIKYEGAYYSPYESPMKCVTPAEEVDFEKRLSDRAVHIKATLEDARVRLRKGMEKEFERMTLRADHMRQASRKAAKTLKESSTIYMKNIKTSSSKMSKTMKLGVVMGVEQIKGHVLSMKEFCGTGDMMATISTISVSTDVDTQERKQVVKSFTYV